MRKRPCIQFRRLLRQPIGPPPTAPWLPSLLALALCLLSVACHGGMRAAHAIPAPPQRRPNLLRNAQVEHDTQGWELHPEALPSAIAARHEAGCLLLDLNPAETPVTGAWAQSVAVEGGGSYAVSCRVRTQRLEGAAHLRLTFYDSRGKPLDESRGVPLSQDSDWTLNAWRCRAPSGAVRAVLSLEVTGRSGQAAFTEPYLAPDDTPFTHSLIVDWKEAGTLRPLSAVNAVTPALLDVQEPAGEPRPPATACGPLALDALFPNPAANPNDPTAYDFSAADALLAATGPGALVRLRLGSGGSGDLWTAVAWHVVMHYNHEWANGFYYGIRDWQLEPPADGSPAEAALCTALSTLKTYNPQLRIGLGADLAAWEGLLSALRAHGLRPDFLSWSAAADAVPSSLAAGQAQCERLLVRYGLGDVEIIAGVTPHKQGGAHAAARLAATVAYWQDSRLSQWLLHGAASAEDEVNALLARLSDTPHRLFTLGGNDEGLALLAGKSSDGRLAHILIADNGSRAQGYRLVLKHWPPNYRYTIREISPDHPWQVIAEGTEADLHEGMLTSRWRSPAVHWIELRW